MRHSLTMVSLAVGILVACSEESNSSNLLAQRDQELRDLAHDYVYKTVDQDESLAIRQEINALTGKDADSFHEILKDQAGYTDEEARFFDASYEYTKSLGVGMLDGTVEDLHDVIQLSYGVDLDAQDPHRAFCLFPKVSCPYVTSWNSSKLTMSTCTSGCVAGNWSDHVGNEACEVLSCDFRLQFPTTTATTIDGTTSAADCVVNYYGGFIWYVNGSNTYALFGVSGQLACGLLAGLPQNFFQVK